MKRSLLPSTTYAGFLTACKQQGFLIPLAIFILVVMAVLALSISRMVTQSTVSGAQEVTNVQAFYAAQSGAERGMQQLFFPDASSRQAADARCAALSQNYSFAVTGLNNCRVVSCSCNYQDGTSCSSGTASNYNNSAATTKLISTYKITSVGSCGSGNYAATRTIEVGSFLKQE